MYISVFTVEPSSVGQEEGLIFVAWDFVRRVGRSKSCHSTGNSCHSFGRSCFSPIIDFYKYKDEI